MRLSKHSTPDAMHYPAFTPTVHEVVHHIYMAITFYCCNINIFQIGWTAKPLYRHSFGSTVSDIYLRIYTYTYSIT